MNKQFGTVYWITGLSGAGKTTIGTLLYNYLKQKKDNIVFLDGDILRQIYKSKSYSSKGRKRLAFQHSRLCQMLSNQGIDVVICVIAMFDDVRKWNRENLQSYKEIYLRVEIEELIRRDQKALYSRALKNEIDNVLGINLPFDEPMHSDLIIDNFGMETPERTIQKIITYWGL